MVLALAACGPETTSFRTTDRGDGSERAGPPAATYAIGETAQVHVWSNGGYLSPSDEPMTHIGFEIHATRPIVFDTDALGLALFDKYGILLPPARFVSVTPLGPSQLPIAAATTTALDAYFLLPVRPRTVGTMRVHWSLQIGDSHDEQVTTFVRDDSYPVADPPARGEPTNPST